MSGWFIAAVFKFEKKSLSAVPLVDFVHSRLILQSVEISSIEFAAFSNKNPSAEINKNFSRHWDHYVKSHFKWWAQKNRQNWHFLQHNVDVFGVALIDYSVVQTVLDEMYHIHTYNLS